MPACPDPTQALSGFTEDWVRDIDAPPCGRYTRWLSTRQRAAGASRGIFGDLEELLASLGIEGAWEEKPNCWRIKTRDGVGMNRSESMRNVCFGVED
jgi:hypothetical protein